MPRNITRLALACLVLLLPLAAPAQQGLTPEQLRMLQQMTPAQRQALIESLSAGAIPGGIVPADAVSETQIETPEEAPPEEVEEEILCPASATFHWPD